MEPKKDFVLIRDGEDANAIELVTLTGQQHSNPQFVRSTGNRLYVYTRTDQADSRRGYRFVYFMFFCTMFILRYFVHISLSIGTFISILILSWIVLQIEIFSQIRPKKYFFNFCV